MKKVGTHTKSGMSFECSRIAVHRLIKKSRRLVRENVVKEVADRLPQQQKKTSNRQNNRIYFDGPKKDVQLERLYSEGNKFSKRSWYPLR